MNASAERRLIVNADDLGRTAGINAGIFAAHAEGIVTSATLMVTERAAEEAAEEFQQDGDLGVGLHITLTGGSRPVLPSQRVPSLVDMDDRFPRRPEEVTGAVPAEVRVEAEAQLQRFCELTGRLPTHLDSHHHVHRQPAIGEALVSLAKEHRLPVRNASPQVGKALRQAGVHTSEHFVERFFGEDARLEVMLALLQGLESGLTELMCHPGRVDAALRAESSYVEERQRELEILTHPEVLAAVRQAGIRLVHFGNAWND